MPRETVVSVPGTDEDEASLIESSRMPLVEHLRELRTRIGKALIAFGLGALGSWFLYEPVLNLMLRPYRKAVEDPEKPLYTLGLLEGFSIRLKVVAFVGLLIALPVILWQFWRFVAPGLKKQEKRYAVGFVLSSLILFAFGTVVAYLTAVPAFGFLLKIGGTNLEPIITGDKYLGFFMAMCIAFGVAFEFPILLLFLVMIGALDSKRLIRGWRIAVLIVVIVAAVITPSQDPITMLAMAAPMILFYLAVIVISRFIMKK